MSQARIEDRQGRKRGSEHTRRYLARFGEESNERTYARLHGKDVEVEEPEEMQPIVCPRCDKETPRKRDRCMWCHFALSHDAAKDADSGSTVDRAPPRPRRRNIDLGNLDVASTLTVAPELERPGGSDGPARLTPPTVESRTAAETPPELTNWKEVSAAFLRAYRPNVRQPGTVLLWLRVGPDGRVAESRVKRATGDPAMAEAALQTTEVMVFKPATMRDRPVESWTELPINFSSK